jgi:hypothetical protein
MVLIGGDAANLHDNVAFVIARKHGHNIVNSTDAKQNQMLPCDAEKGAHDSFLIKGKLGLSLTRS